MQIQWLRTCSYYLCCWSLKTIKTPVIMARLKNAHKIPLSECFQQTLSARAVTKTTEWYPGDHLLYWAKMSHQSSTEHTHYKNFDLWCTWFLSRLTQRTLCQSDLCSLLLNNQNNKWLAKEFAGTAHKNFTAQKLGGALFELDSILLDNAIIFLP